MNFKAWLKRVLVRKSRILLVMLLSMFGAGCGTLLPDFGYLPYHQQMTHLPSGSLCRVAVLPFLSDTDFPLADAIVHKVFTSEFKSSSDSLVVQEGDILKVYQQLHILPGVEPTLEQLQITADRVDAQLLITGIVMEMREDRGEHGTVIPVILMEIQIRDGHTGQTLWKTLHKRNGTDYKKTMHFGTIHTVTGLSRQMTEEILTLWYKKGLRKCNVSLRS
jgi:hypothetical protein